MAEFAQPKNRAFLFIKPHAATDATVALVAETLAARGVRIVAQGTLDGPTIDANRLIDQHYYSIASKATLQEPKELAVPPDAFEEFFKVPWAQALKTRRAVNALQAAKALNLSPDELQAKWKEICAAKEMIKFGGGFYCCQIEKLFVFNPFFLAMRQRFTAPGAEVRWFDVEWDPAALSWESFRNELLGPTDPAAAPEGSLRNLIYQRWEALGLKAQPYTSDNGVHASASPFEGLAERMNWLGADPAEDSYGKALIAAGVPVATLREWSKDPRIDLDTTGLRGSVFDALEDMDAGPCLKRAVELEGIY